MVCASHSPRIASGCRLLGSSRVVSVIIICRINRIVIQNESLDYCFIPHVGWTFRSFSSAVKIMAKKWMKILSLAGEREGDIF